MEQFWSGMQLLRKQYAHRLEAVCRQWDITRAEMDVLLFLFHNHGLNRAADIVELQGLTKSHVSIAAKALCDRGFLAVTDDAIDHRVIRLELTEAALEVVTDGEAAQRSYFEELFGCFSQEELQQWLQLQEKLFAKMREMGDIG